jgi:hypothetical protein
MTACSRAGGEPLAGASPKATAAAWPEADALFHADPRWLGGDVAYSVDLGAGRVLWLFGDTFVATTPAHRRSESTMVRNSVAIQTGYDPSHATIAFRWGERGGIPAAFFAGEGDHWFWPASGVIVEGRLVLFLSRVARSDRGLGFRLDGWAAVRVDNPADDPSAWSSSALSTPASRRGVTFGEAVLVRGGLLYAFGAEDDGDHAVYLVRWPASAVGRRDLSKPEWWTPSGWVEEASLTVLPEPLFRPGSTELSVQPDPSGQGWIELQTVGFGAATLCARRAPDLVGPWSAPLPVYTPPESSGSGVLVYAGKGHPELQGADLVATYVANAASFAALVDDVRLYYPRFVRMSR